MSGSGGLEHTEQFLQAEGLYSEYKIFIGQFEALDRIEASARSMLVIQTFCYELETRQEVMKAVTRLYTASQTDFQRALFCSWMALVSARHFSLSLNNQRLLFFGGLLQDIGKYVVDNSVARFISNLSGNKIPIYGQHDLEDAHPLLSSSFIEHQFPDEDKLKDLVLHHHARADGTGYPNFVVESQLGLDDQILIVANEINDRLDHLGGYSDFYLTLPYLKLAGMMYFSKVQQSMHRMLTGLLAPPDEAEQSRVCGAGAVAASSSHALRNKERSAILKQCVDSLLAFSSELIPYDFDIVVRGIRSNIARLVFLMNESGLSQESAFRPEDDLSEQERSELDEMFGALPECLYKFKYYLDYLKGAKQFEVCDYGLKQASDAVRQCLFAFDRAASF